MEKQHDSEDALCWCKDCNETKIRSEMQDLSKVKIVCPDCKSEIWDLLVCPEVTSTPEKWINELNDAVKTYDNRDVYPEPDLILQAQCNNLKCNCIFNIEYRFMKITKV